MRPAIYTAFDLSRDVMTAVNKDREDKLNSELAELRKDPIQRGLKKNDLEDDLAECRVQVSVVPKYFDKHMQALSHQFCNEIYEKLMCFKTKQPLKARKEKVDHYAWECYMKRKQVNLLSDEIRNLPLDPYERSDYLFNCTVVYFAVYQKYIFIRKGELPN